MTRVRARIAGRIVCIERASRIQRFIDEVVIAAAVKLIGARFHGDVENTAAHLPVFRREVRGLDGGLLDGIHAGLGLLRDARSPGVGCVLALDPERLRVGRRAVDAHQRVRDVIHAGDHHGHVHGIPNSRAARFSSHRRHSATRLLISFPISRGH